MDPAAKILRSILTRSLSRLYEGKNLWVIGVWNAIRVHLVSITTSRNRRTLLFSAIRLSSKRSRGDLVVVALLCRQFVFSHYDLRTK